MSDWLQFGTNFAGSLMGAGGLGSVTSSLTSGLTGEETDAGPPEDMSSRATGMFEKGGIVMHSEDKVLKYGLTAAVIILGLIAFSKKR